MRGALALAPLVDMCRHAEAADATARVDVNASSGTLALRALRDIAAGEEARPSFLPPACLTAACAYLRGVLHHGGCSPGS